MFRIKFKITFTRSGKNTHVIRIQQSGALCIPLGGTSKLYSQCTHMEEASCEAEELCSVILHHWEERRTEHIKSREIKKILDLNRA